jgi:hypothetical protein
MLIGKPAGKGTLGRFARRWEDNAKMDLKEIQDLEWTDHTKVARTYQFSTNFFQTTELQNWFV